MGWVGSNNEWRSATDIICLVLICIVGMSAIILGFYFTYMNEHGKRLIFKDLLANEMRKAASQKEKGGEQRARLLTNSKKDSKEAARD